MKRLLGFLLLFLTGCTGLHELSSHLTRTETNTVVSLAREKVLASGLVNDANEIEIIRNGTPKLSYYLLAWPYADYSVYWRVNNKESVGVYGLGNILALENSRVTRGDTESAKPG